MCFLCLDHLRFQCIVACRIHILQRCARAISVQGVMKRLRFTADRLCEPAKKAQADAVKEYKKYKEELGIKIECRYHHVCVCQPAAFHEHAPYLITFAFYRFPFACATNPYLYMRRYAPEKSPPKLKAESEVAFEWSCKGINISATHMHKMLCRNTVCQAVPFPSHWRTAIPFVTDVTKLLRAATVLASRKAENAIVTCKLLGIPADDDRLDVLCGEESGTVVSLRGNTEAPQDFLLVADVDENIWICHPGSNANGLFCEVAPFDLKDLVAKNIREDRIEDPPSQRRLRITKKQPARDLLNAAESNPSAWSAARAYALWLAEETRADGRAFHLDQARACFENDPFQWKTTEGEWSKQRKHTHTLSYS